MYSQRTARDIAEFERFLGNSHRCQRCGHAFLAHEDGCPACGASNGCLTRINRPVSKPTDSESFIEISLEGEIRVTGGPEIPLPKQS